MKLTIEDKIRKFEIALYDSLSLAHSEALASTRLALKKELMQASMQAREEKKQIEERTVKRTQNQINKTQSEALQDQRTQLLLLKSEYNEKLFDILRKRILQMPRAQYESFLRREITNALHCFAQESVVITLHDEDLAFVKALVASCPSPVRFVCTSTCKHKVVIESEDKTRMISVSPLDLLEEKKDELVRLIEKQLEEAE